MKNVWSRHHEKESEPGVLIPLACGTVSSTCGQLVSYPLSLVRTRLQAQSKRTREERGEEEDREREGGESSQETWWYYDIV